MIFKFLMMVLVLTMSFSVFGKEWKSIYTDVKNDCVVISSSTEEAPIDFFEAECKSFGGYQLYISGGDLRYSPKLKFEGADIDLQKPSRFHDLISHKMEWIYTIETDIEGFGSLEWKGFIYRLSIATDDDKDITQYFAVRLKGQDSCLLGTAQTNEEARDLVYDQTLDCLAGLVF